jgi:enoyl-CoA hydratase
MKATLHDMAGVDEHGAAVERELVDQVWSIRQPAFQERLAALQARITGK